MTVPSDGSDGGVRGAPAAAAPPAGWWARFKAAGAQGDKLHLYFHHKVLY